MFLVAPTTSSRVKIVKAILEDGRDWLDSIDTQTGLFTTKLLDAYETS